jgi:hypothetical protein
MLVLPVGHSDSELDLARRVARQLGTEDLHVFWSDRSLPARRTGAHPTRGQALAALGAAIGALATVASALGSRHTRR